ncbi:hypothetical protein F4780DRAFT_622779 [Xylariomycetidae sp. FL0641]|nr:hypothetical protein F4780DRAFT_622779 [Xylariomycetidae sp. FL0641]
MIRDGYWHRESTLVSPRRPLTAWELWDIADHRKGDLNPLEPFFRSGNIEICWVIRRRVWTVFSGDLGAEDIHPGALAVTACSIPLDSIIASGSTQASDEARQIELVMPAGSRVQRRKGVDEGDIKCGLDSSCWTGVVSKHSQSQVLIRSRDCPRHSPSNQHSLLTPCRQYVNFSCSCRVSADFIGTQSRSHHKDSSGKHTKPPSVHHKHDNGHSHEHSQRNYNVSFLFVVNELVIDPQSRAADEWGNDRPPVMAHHYVHENVGGVFRYRNGRVSRAANSYWTRDPNEGGVGKICQQLPSPNGITEGQWVYLAPYRTSTVFDCGPFLPCVYDDVDARIVDVINQDPPYNQFWALSFTSERNVSRMGVGGTKAVNAPHSNWMGRLVPASYAGKPEHTEALGGQLGPLLGLMALTQASGHTDDAFNHCWNRNNWHGRRNGCVAAGEAPRGVIVYVALEFDQERGQTREDIETFESSGFAVI